MITKVKGVLLRPVSYNRLNGESVSLPVGTDIIVDINSPFGYTALAGEDHFSIEEHEFLVVYIN